jgi:hypothetical protein
MSYFHITYFIMVSENDLMEIIPKEQDSDFNLHAI